ncbi:MAG: helix-turn-helix domain-containing protein [Bacteroidetes bacterium]|nr:helix-turn-helix domain-containing protein [Bacteroidota bacterium]
MSIINDEALRQCVEDAVRKIFKEHSPEGQSPPQQERLMSKQKLAAELGISLVTLTDWMKKGLPFMRLHKRVYFKKSEVLSSMQQTMKNKEAKV